jgi:hypothetical protein
MLHISSLQFSHNSSLHNPRVFIILAYVARRAVSRGVLSITIPLKVPRLTANLICSNFIFNDPPY